MVYYPPRDMLSEQKLKTDFLFTLNEALLLKVRWGCRLHTSWEKLLEWIMQAVIYSVLPLGTNMLVFAYKDNYRFSSFL